jgi:hypothetical protein
LAVETDTTSDLICLGQVILTMDVSDPRERSMRVPVVHRWQAFQLYYEMA